MNAMRIAGQGYRVDLRRVDVGRDLDRDVHTREPRDRTALL